MNIAADELESIAEALGERGFTVELPQSDKNTALKLKIPFISRAAATDWLSSIPAGASGSRRTAVIRSIPKKEWAENWKRNFRPIRVSKRLVIIPPWHRPRRRSDDTIFIRIEPGLCFGTGRHSTTRMCLELIETLYAPGRSFLDIGCGSGILAIAAAMLGYRPVAAFDNDADATRKTRENALRNNIQDRIAAAEADIRRARLNRTFDVVAANILASTLVQNAGRISNFAAKPVGFLVLSGILAGEQRYVRSAYERLGFKLLSRLEADGWAALCLRRT